MRRLLIAALVATVAAASPAAADLDDFNAAVSEASRAYRAALFYLRTGNAGLAAIELANAMAMWQDVEARFAAAPPAEFADDSAFAADLAAVGRALAAGSTQADAGDAAAARAAVATVPGILLDLRRRNGVDVYGDCVTELGRRMDALYVYRHSPPNLADPEAAATVKEAAATYAAQLARCREMAPEAYRAAEEFRRLYDGTAQSVASMASAVERGDAGGLINILRELRSFDRMIFLRWG